jgi:hypothetical protein
MSSGDRKFINAVECSKRAGRYAFGLDEIKTAEMLRRLADDLENGKVLVHRVTTSCHATQDEFTIREIVVELLEEALRNKGPQAVGDGS